MVCSRYESQRQAEVEFLEFEEARDLVRKKGLRGHKEWQKWSAGGARPPNMPAAPDKFYSDTGWVSWVDWLGSSRRDTRWVHVA